MTLELVVGDTAPTLTGTFNADCTGAAVPAIHIKRADATVINRNGAWVSPAAGTWSLPLITGDLTVRGTYYIEGQVTYAGGAIQTFRDDATGARVLFTVADQIA